MKKYLALLFLATICFNSSAQISKKIPFVYDSESSIKEYPELNMLGIDQLKEQKELPNPLLMFDGKTKVTNLFEWQKRREEIAQMIQYYEIGEKPKVSLSDIHAEMSGDTLKVTVNVNGQSLLLTSVISYPKGNGPFL